MAHFIGFVQGNRGEASRLGSKDSGIEATARGWDIGGGIKIFHNKETGKDELRIYVDKGSNNRSSTMIARCVEGEEPTLYDSEGNEK